MIRSAKIVRNSFMTKSNSFLFLYDDKSDILIDRKGSIYIL